MRRLAITCSVMAAMLAIAPAAALARHHSSRHHSRVHHTRAHHRSTRSARVRRFGTDVSNPATTPSSPADTAGTVQSFQNGVLTIQLNGGSTTVSGTVIDTTILECMAAEETSSLHQDGDGGSGSNHGGSGDNSGRGDNGGGDAGSQTTSGQSSGDDQGDVAEQNETEANDPTVTEANEPADDQNENENEAGNNCSTMNLTPGATVREAELRISSAGKIWSKVELGS